MSELEQQQQQPISAVGIGRIAAIFVLVFGATALAVRCVAVASQSPHGNATGDKSQGAQASGPVLTIEQVAAKTGCQPKIQTNAAELRQGVCSTQAGRYFVTTFSTSQAQRSWLEQAEDYGALLVGNRWVVGASPKVLGQLKGKLGGDLYDMSHHGKGARSG